MASTSSNPAFAFVVNSILNNNKNSKILSKAKKENEWTITKKGDDDEIDFVDEHGQPITSENNTLDTKNKCPKSKEDNKIFKTKKLDKKKSDLLCLKKPNIVQDREKEKKLKIIATKGVVQLFNVVREKQQTLKNRLNEAGPSDSKRTKILTDFTDNELEIDVPSKKDKKNNKVNEKSKTKRKKWSVLEDDFMIGAKLKDWDKEEDSD